MVLLAETDFLLLAGGVAAGLAAMLLLALAVYYFRCQLNIPQFCLYVLNQLVVRLIWRGKASGPLPVPAGQGAVVVCNHRSSVDPFFPYLATRRVVHWMVAAEYCRGVAGILMRICQVIPVNRSGIDTAATKQAIRLAGEGRLVGMFPEGRLNKTEELLLPGRPGAAMVALQARVPIVPCYVRGSPVAKTLLGHFRQRSRVELKVGQAIDISEFYDRADDREVQESITRTLLIEIARLAGVENFQPQIAGRRWKPGPETADPGDARNP